MKRGFTLIEMIVAVAIFGLIGTMAISSLLVLTTSNRVAQNSREALDNLDFVFDDIIRELRSGSKYHCPLDINTPANDANPQNCTSGESTLALTRVDDPQYIVRYSTTTINGKSAIVKSINGDTPVIMTAEGVNIKLFKFYTFGSAEDDNLASRVGITLQAEVIVGPKATSSIALQTSVVQRATDN